LKVENISEITGIMVNRLKWVFKIVMVATKIMIILCLLNIVMKILDVIGKLIALLKISY
jgi:hypothetical protein